MATKSLRYQTGFGNELESEAEPGILPRGRNSPQRPARGLVSELISGTTFSAPRAFNRRTYAFRARPSVMHGPFTPSSVSGLRTPPFAAPPNPNQLRWDPLPLPKSQQDFLDGITTICGNGSPITQSGAAIHIYRATASMVDRHFLDADGELILMPDSGTLLVVTELGRLEVGPGEIALIPRGIKFRVELPDGPSRGSSARTSAYRSACPSWV